MTFTPLRYDPSLEQPAPDEAETTATLIETMRGINETTFKDSGHGLRSVHAKSHALLLGELHVLDGLPETLAQGAFAKPGTYQVAMRFSTNPGDVLDDAVSAPRGLAIKIVGVEGERLEGSDGAATQDFVMANAPAFGAPTPRAFLGNLKLLAKTTDAAQGLKKALSFVLRGTEAAIESVGLKSATVLSLGGQPLTHVLGETFYTQTPFLHGPYVAKLSVAPVSANLTALTGSKVDVSGKPDGLREAATQAVSAEGGEWEVRVQLRTNADTMPIEDASAVWPEDESAYIAVARITVPAQAAWSEARSAAYDDGLSFSPWHGLAAHRPLGGVNRARKPAYEMSVDLRGARNGCPMHEPRALERLA